MDIASLVGLIGAVGMIIGSMIVAGGLGPFIDIPSILIVFGGTFFAVMFTAPMGTFLGSFGSMAKAFMPRLPKHGELVETMVELSDVARREGMMALEKTEVPDKFFEKGLQMLVDGKSNKQIGSALFIAEGTVKNSITELISKLGVKDRTQLAVYAIRNKLA